MVKKTLKIWRWMTLVILVMTVMQVVGQSASTRGPRWPRYCSVQKKYNLTKRVKYRAPTAIRTYEWCLNFPPRCSKWTTEMRELTRLETEERVAEVEVCCPGYKYGPQGECEAFCGPGKTGQNCDEDCEPRYYGPSCSRFCDPKECVHGQCEYQNGICTCDQSWEGRNCNVSVTTTTTTTTTSTTTTVAPTTNIVPTTTLTSTAARISTFSTTAVSTITESKVVFTIPSTSHSNFDPVLARAKTNDVTKNVQKNQTDFVKAIVEHPKVSDKFINSTNITRDMTTQRTVIQDVTIKNIGDNTFANKKAEFIEVPSNKFLASTLKTTELPLTTSITKTAVGAMSTKLDSILSSQETSSTKTPVLTSKSFENSSIFEEIPKTRLTETTRKPPVTHKYVSTTKFKPKEIWIRPALKGDTPIVDLKIKPTQDIQYKHKTPKDFITSENSTTKTIIVSIIPTSVSASFKKIALSTASYMSPKTNISIISTKSSTNGFTRPMTAQTTTPVTLKPNSTTLFTTARIETIIESLNKSGSVKGTLANATNRMSTTTEALTRLNFSNTITTVSLSSKISKTTEFPTLKNTQMMAIPTPRNISLAVTNHNESTRKVSIVQNKVTVLDEPNLTQKPHVTSPIKINKKPNNINTKNVTNSNSNLITENPVKGPETFDILTEPEHITAVMSDKGDTRSSMDLISVISIAGGVMMAVITVAVVIVMLERCRRPRYDDVRKYNDVSMNVIIDNHDVPPPPYVRSIFHTPLPEPPISEKCHYQPISTLDRNLKQFMRPVVVQTISPIMLENFRGILECHYDHLPRRNHERHVGSLTTPSADERCELLPQRRHSVSELTIEALKCEAKMDVIDHTTSEPLYAEIPCWRPPSEHAVEVVNFNGEAVTEL